MTEEEQKTTTKERNAKTSQAEVLKLAKLMVAGMTAHAEELAKRGIDSAFITGLQGNVTNVEKLDSEQETLKASLKTKTAEFNVTFTEVQKTISEAKKLIKLTIPPEGWIEFGITDKR